MDDKELLRRFCNCTLPFDEWTHRAHVKIAFLALREFGLEGSIPRLREKIQAYNSAHNRPDGPTMGYNETTTVAFLHLVHATMKAYESTFPTPNADSFCDTHPHLLNKHILRLFYSPERRMDPAAKFEFLEPDLAPLPRVVD